MEDSDFLFKVMLFSMLGLGAVMTVVIILALRAQQKQEALNDASPVVTLSAQLIKKRYHTNRKSVSAPVHYYLTFQTLDGDVSELRVSAQAYHACNEGESGELTVQGTRFHGFVPQGSAGQGMP